MPPKRKRTPTAKAAANSAPKRARQMTVETDAIVNNQSASSLDRQKLVEELVPAVTKSVVETLVTMNIIPIATTTPVADAGTEDTNSVLQLPESSATTSPGTCFPISMHVDAKLKGKIWANEFVDLASLLPKQQPDDEETTLRMVESTSGLVVLRKSKPKSLLSLPKWFSAFHCYVAIYTERYPDATAALMQYIETIRKLGQRAGDKAALFYDSHFRRLRQHDPSLSFSSLHTDTYTEALAMGLTQQKKAAPVKSIRPFRTPGTSQSTLPCYSYNNNNGRCTRKQCTHRHICQKCSGPHSKKSCNKRGQQPDLSKSDKATNFTTPTNKL